MKTITTSILYTERESELKHGSIHLSDYLSKDVQWCDVHVTGPDSVITTDDEVLLSRRPVSMTFEHEGKMMKNTSDASCLAYRNKETKELRATGKTFLYEMHEPEEEISAGGIVLMKKTVTKEHEPIWVTCHAAGKDTGLPNRCKVLIAYKSDAYSFKIDNLTLHNAGVEEIIAYHDIS